MFVLVVDSWICPQQIEEAIASGVTSMFGGGTGPVRTMGHELSFAMIRESL